MGEQKSTRKSSISSHSSNIPIALKNSRGIELIRLNFLELQQAPDKEKETYKSFLGHANILEMLNVYNLLKNSTITPAIFSGWMWHSWRGEVNEKGYPEGEGRAYLGMNVYYNGGFKHGLLHGHGLLKWETEQGEECAYKGKFFYNCLHESGDYNWKGRGTYSGKVFNGFPNKNGVMQKGTHGHAYDGTFVFGLREGLGKMVFKDGKNVLNYKGDWVQDKKHGQGRYLYKFATYQGQWIHGKREGFGIQTELVNQKENNPLHMPIFAASVYEGNWHNGFPHGRGKHIWIWDHNKETLGLLHNAYVGDFEHGMRSNRGTFYYASGALYQGFWKNNFKDGHGLYTYEDGRLNKVRCDMDHFQFHNEKTIMILIQHALDSVTEEDIDIESLKLKLQYLTLRFINTFRTMFHNHSAYSTYRNMFNSQAEKKQFDTNVEDIKHDDEFIGESALKNDLNGLPLLLEANLVVPMIENSKPILVPEQPIIDQSVILLKIALKKYCLCKTTSTNLSIKEDFKDEVSKSYLNFIVKYVRNGGKKNTIFGDALDNVDDNLYYIYKNLRLEGQTYAMNVDNFWRLCYDAHIVELGLGLAQIDAIIYPPSNAWDDSFDYYNPKRQLIHREVIENLVKIGLSKYFGYGMQVDKKLQVFFEHCFEKIENKDDDSIYKFMMDQRTQDVLFQYEKYFRILFSKFVLKCKTNVFLVRLDHIVHLFLDVIYLVDIHQENDIFVERDTPLLPLNEGKDVFEGNILPKRKISQDYILNVIFETLYQTNYLKKDPQLYLDLEINFKEFEILMVKFGLLKFGAYKHLEDGNPMKEHGQMVQRFMDEISHLEPKPNVPIMDEEPFLEDQENSTSES